MDDYPSKGELASLLSDSLLAFDPKAKTECCLPRLFRIYNRTQEICKGILPLGTEEYRLGFFHPSTCFLIPKRL
jgi:hypothetical protein